MQMINYDEFLMELYSIFPLPNNDNACTSAGGVAEVDLTDATTNIEKVIKKYKRQNRLTTAEVKKLKQFAVERYYDYRKANKK